MYVVYVGSNVGTEEVGDVSREWVAWTVAYVDSNISVYSMYLLVLFYFGDLFYFLFVYLCTHSCICLKKIIGYCVVSLPSRVSPPSILLYLDIACHVGLGV